MNGGGGMVAIVPSPGAATLNKTRSARLPTLHKVTKLAPPPTFSLLERELSEASSEPRKNTILSLSCPFGDRSKHRGIPLRAQAIQTPTLFIPAGRPNRTGNDQEQPQIRPTHRHCIPQSRDTPPKRDTGIASEKDWGINLENGERSESGMNEDGSTWYRESGQDIGDNGYCCHWTVMGGRSADGLSEWKEAWWDKSDWTGYKELGAEKSGKNAQGDSWWETWQEIFRQDDWSNLARIERSAQKQAKSGNGTAGWYEKWWEKYNAKGSTEKGAHKYGRLNDQSWWEKWGEQYDGQGAVLKWTDKWAENDKGSRWGDKWEEKFFLGMGTRQGETWHIAPIGERWSRTWGEEHFGNGKVHKYGTSTSGESWDEIADESTIYESEPHYGWADAIGNSSQLLGIEPQERPPGVYPEIDFTSAPPIPPIPPTPPIPPSSSPSPHFSPPTTLSMPSSSSLMSIPPSLLSSSLPSSLDPSSSSSSPPPPPPPPPSSSPPLTPLDSQPETSPSPPLPPSSEPPPPSELPPPQSPPNAEPE